MFGIKLFENKPRSHLWTVIPKVEGLIMVDGLPGENLGWIKEWGALFLFPLRREVNEIMPDLAY